jgi:deazaflavin-dependent oxidoreductase (nitroreductase family)
LIDGLFRQLARRGLGKNYLHVLTVTGTKSDEPRSVPVDVMEVDGERYLVAPHGEVNWVGNLRVAKRATLHRAARSPTYDAVELRPDAGDPLIR